MDIFGDECVRTPVLHTIHADGTFVISSSGGFGGLSGAPGSLIESLQHLSWEKTGSREMTWRAMIFLFDPAGTLVLISRTWGVNTFDEDFNGYDTVFHVRVIPAGELADDCGFPDPNNPDAFVAFATDGTSRAERLNFPLD
ncbi:MAG: hypothetical protein ACE5EX_00035 [Phycisphaerae bacterium]